MFRKDAQGEAERFIICQYISLFNVLCFRYCRHVTVGKTGNIYFMEWAEWHPVFILSLLCELKTDSLKGQMLKFLSPVKDSY